MSKLTLKNVLVYNYFKDNAQDDEAFVKTFYTRNADEIKRRFGISNYAGFNFHVRKSLDHQSEIHKLDSKENIGGLEK